MQIQVLRSVSLYLIWDPRKVPIFDPLGPPKRSKKSCRNWYPLRFHFIAGEELPKIRSQRAWGAFLVSKSANLVHIRTIFTLSWRPSGSSAIENTHILFWLAKCWLLLHRFNHCAATQKHTQRNVHNPQHTPPRAHIRTPTQTHALACTSPLGEINNATIQCQ